MSSCHDEGPTRSPVPLTLKLPQPPRRWSGLTASLLLHGVVLGLMVGYGERLWRRTLAPGDAVLFGGRPSAAGGGGNRVAYITLPSLPEPAATRVPKVAPPVPHPQLVVPPAPQPEQPKAVTPQPVNTVAAPPAAAPGDSGTGKGTGSATAPGEGQGRGTGTSAGQGPGGPGAKVRPPEPRDMAFPFDTPPKELRGVSLNVTFWVQVDGKVERYTVEPEIKDREYAKKFDEVMRAFRFTPARAPDGTRVPGTTRISFTLPGKRSS
ncbi:MAG TPA: hypothetical protein VGN76_14035 [Gemmatimonadales bacterium]|nr:hypothetical protein [Gemmatimonadales bacterium]